MSYFWYYLTMKRINNPNLLKQYLKNNNFSDIFDQNISNICELLYFDTGEYLIKHGTISKYLLFMVEGECRFFTFSNTGEHIPFGKTSSFEVFGEVSSLWEHIPNNVVQAIKPTYCIGIELKTNRKILLNDLKFLRYICRLLSRRVLEANMSLTSFVGAKATNRLASFILQNSQNNIFEIKLTNCSESIGISYRHLLRLMNTLCENKILKKQRRKYQILNIKKLKELSLIGPE